MFVGKMAKFRFLLGARLRASVSHWLSARGHHQFQVNCWPEAALSHLPHPHGCLLHQSQHVQCLPAGRKSESFVTQSRSGVLSHLLYFLGWKHITGHTQGEEVTKGQETTGACHKGPS